MRRDYGDGLVFEETRCPACGRYMSFGIGIERTLCTWCHQWYELDWQSDKYGKLELSKMERLP